MILLSLIAAAMGKHVYTHPWLVAQVHAAQNYKPDVVACTCALKAVECAAHMRRRPAVKLQQGGSVGVASTPLLRAFKHASQLPHSCVAAFLHQAPTPRTGWCQRAGGRSLDGAAAGGSSVQPWVAATWMVLQQGGSSVQPWTACWLRTACTACSVGGRTARIIRAALPPSTGMPGWGQQTRARLHTRCSAPVRGGQPGGWAWASPCGVAPAMCHA